jgi:hypothetical protein
MSIRRNAAVANDTNAARPRPVIGWREWLALPDLGIPAIKAKIDTGARSSALHSHFIERFAAEGRQKVRFGVSPLAKSREPSFVCEAELLDYRSVKDSGGHSEKRCFIRTTVDLSGHRWPIDLSLTSRRGMLFRMLLGRKAIENVFLIDPGKSYATGRDLARRYRKKVAM